MTPAVAQDKKIAVNLNLKIFFSISPRYYLLKSIINLDCVKFEYNFIHLFVFITENDFFLYKIYTIYTIVNSESDAKLQESDKKLMTSVVLRNRISFSNVVVLL